MTTTSTTAVATTDRTRTHLTRTYLTLGASAGPIYVVVATVQALTRTGFDIRRHPVSVLANGPLGWIQIANFVVTGLLVIAAAAGLRRARQAGWGPRLLGVYGVGLVLAGVFVADPVNGFPVGAAAPPAGTISAGGLGHMVAGGLGFLAFVAACLVFARRFAHEGRRAWAAGSAATGIVFLGAFMGIASGVQNPAINLTFTAAVVIAWAWLTALTVSVRRTCA